MGVFTEHLIEVDVQDHSHNFSKKFVAPGGHPKRPFFPILLGHIGSPGWLPVISFLLQRSNDGIKGFQ